MSIKEYNLGDIIEDGGKHYIVVKYKGKFVCGNVNYLTRLKDYNIDEKCDIANSLSELYDKSRDYHDRLATVAKSDYSKRLKYFKPGEIIRDSFLDNLILWQKPNGKEVWVSMRALKTHDLDELLHIRYHYQTKDKLPYKDFPVEIIAVAP